ncbi:universal stress protein [Ammoniphilus sp. CFH 90114]|uniref:universal stress protein n=1 Tax=Ammoniphilus sp. CFH 90114 TaxID=2493665 RepID=UPI001028518E|nr:universal stress protein [Ammoniphilus sp. CFH 90114]RXT02318.1 universal stress protein [Ammoniphilus sp. CFH 90114]
MLFTKILVAYDGSQLSDLALQKAIKLAQWDSKIEIHVIHVGTYRMYLKEYKLAGEMKQSITIPVLEGGEEIILKIKQSLKPLANPWRTYLLKGYPGKVIVRHAEQYHCDLILIGNKGASKWKEWLLGSVSWYVVQHSTVPVLVIKNSKK